MGNMNQIMRQAQAMQRKLIKAQEELAAMEVDGSAGGGVEFAVSDRYEFLPGDNWDPLDENTRYADPRPHNVLENPNQNRIQTPSHRPRLLEQEGPMRPRLTFDDGMEVVEVLMTAYQSAEQGKTVEFPPKGLDKFVPAVARGAWRP
jgi:hypothetical protein